MAKRNNTKRAKRIMVVGNTERKCALARNGRRRI